VFLPGLRGSADTEKADAYASAFFSPALFAISLSPHAGLSK
jgi:hypothetical protein